MGEEVPDVSDASAILTDYDSPPEGLSCRLAPN